MEGDAEFEKQLEVVYRAAVKNGTTYIRFSSTTRSTVLGAAHGMYSFTTI